ncbi:nickel-dependent hydrogenase large subunit [Marinospirillum perlucidum]|uniref:nickel-dependent hydrogenase large subunit n=1 Tax=Marinospirillum perlucidum TaxID=1982602 RepID=UPI000DF497C2|nr:nickel-dependent hydrogenase large subunit [Marinospirillum perlucidum]
MPSLQSLTGQLQLRLDWSRSRIRRVEVELQRPLQQLSRLWTGRRPEEVLQLMPLTFAVCSLAQQAASVQALEAATGWEADPAIHDWRQQAVRLEALRETLLLLHSWQPQACPDSFLPWLQATQPLLGQWQSVMGFQQQGLPEQLEQPADLELLYQELLQAEQQVQPGEQLACPSVVLSPASCEPLEEEDWPHLLAQLRRGDASAHLAGDPRVTGLPATRKASQANDQVSQAFLSLLHQAQSLTRALMGEGELRQYPPLPLTRPGEGWARVMTARGWLMHRVEVEAGRIAGYQLLAPTDWNLHPQGLLFQQLKNLKVDKADLQPLASALMACQFPCVESQVEIEYA